MVTFVVICFLIGFFARMLSVMIKADMKRHVPVRVERSCPPHQWSYKKVLNEDGSVNHEYISCAKCGPLHGVEDNG